MPNFDLAAAKKAGYSNAEITQFLSERNGFDIQGAKKAGYSDDEILAKLAPDATAVDRANAMATGFNRGAITRTLGLPVDTVQNIIDLGKAGVGTVVTALGRPDLAPEVTSDRSGIVGSGDWIEKKVRDVGGSVLIDPSGPIDSTSRVLHSAGMGAGSAVVGGKLAPSTVAIQGKNALAGLTGGGAAQVAAENGASPATSILVSMGPQAVAVIPNGTKAAIRGGEKGRQQMAQRIQDFSAAGVDSPSVGLASNNKLVQGLENIFANTPGGVTVMQNARQNIINGMQNKLAMTREEVSPNYGADVSGRLIANDLSTLLKERVLGGYEGINNKLLTLINTEQRFPVTNSLAALSAATSVNPAAPQTTAAFIQPRINTLQRNMLADTLQAPENGAFKGLGVPGAEPANQGLPVSALREVRSAIGREAASNAIIGTPEQADFKTVYGGLSSDIRNAAKITDMEAGPQPNNKGPAERTFDRGNALYRSGMERIERVQPFVNKDAPEQTYNTLIQSGKENVSTLRAVKKSIGEEARASTAATYIDRLGRANPSNQNELGDVWSPERFLTNWNTINPKARKEIFSGFKGSEDASQSMDAIAKAAAMLRDSSKVWANPSGTGANVMAQGAIGATAFGALFNPVLAAKVAGGIGTVNMSARLMTNPKVVKWLAESTKLPDSEATAHLNRLVTMANASKDEQFKKDVAEYVSALAE